MSTITVSQADIGAEAFDVGLLAGLLNEAGEVQTGWFADPATQLKALPGRAKALLQTIQTFVGPQAAVNAPVFAGAEWYEIQNPSTGAGSGFYVVTPPAADAGGLVGLGVQHAVTVGNLSIDFYVFVPLFQINNGSDPDFVLVNAAPAKVSPIKVGVDASSTVVLDAGDAGTFTDFTVEADIALDGSAGDLFALKIAFTGGTMTGADAYASLSAFLNAATSEDRIGALLVQGMAYWLNLYIGSSGHTVGDVLVSANLLGTGQSGNFTYYQYDAAALGRIKTDPLGAAEDILFAVLGALADNTQPLIPLPFLDPASESGDAQDGGAEAGTAGAGDDGGDGPDSPAAGIWIAFEPTDPNAGNNHGAYGMRLMVPDLPIKLGEGETSPTLHLRLGSWFTGETSDETGWVNAIVKGDAPLKPGLSVFLLNYDGTNISFAPSFELTSVGFDLVGAKSTPLFNVGGVTLQGTEARAYVRQLPSWQYGFGARVDQVGIPLGSSFTSGVTSGGGNPVAKSLVASGDDASGSSGGDAASGKTDAVNPQFSLEAAYVSGQVGAAENWFVELLPPNGASGDIVWFPVNRKFGPIDCQKVGLGWNQANIMLDVVLDGGISLAGLSAELVEFSVGIPLSDPTSLSSYQLGLKGLDLAYNGGGAVEIQGGFLKSGSGDTVEYDGLASIKVGDFGIGALGSYASLPGGGTSLFVFAFLDAPLGGPPAFFVTGLAAGFGYNRSLIAPAFDKVADFPLVKGMQDPSALGLTPGQPPDLSSVLTTLKDAVPPTRGEYWLAAGVMFTSFELIQSNVLLAVEFGANFEILILGTSVVRLPQAGPVTMAYAELEIEVLVEPSVGLVEASAVLSPNSYVLDPNCHLTGGFAFFIWFGPNEHAGDFVLTIGGYHPAFKKPDWYPDVPRLGFNWKFSDQIEISGGCYFALTPSCIMAGGSLSFLFSEGSLKAWFDAYADMLISWKPFFYDISVGVTIGVSVRVHFLFVSCTITVEVGADLEIWGPPTGGVAHVHLWVVSFTVGFGPDKSSINTVTDWNGFQQLLPGGNTASSDSNSNKMLLARGPSPAAVRGKAGADDTAGAPVVCQISFAAGVTSTLTNDQSEKVWVVNPAEFSFNIKTTTPVTDASLNGNELELDKASGYFVGARPMGVSDLQTPLTITISGDTDADWQCAVEKSDVPEAVWGRALPPGATPPASANLLLDRVTGLTNVAPEAHPTEGPPVIDMEKSFTDVPVTQFPELLPFAHDPVSQGAVPAQGTDSFSQLKQIMAVSGERSALFAAFDLLRVPAGTDGDLSTMAGNPYYAYSDAPMTGSPLPS